VLVFSNIGHAFAQLKSSTFFALPDDIKIKKDRIFQKVAFVSSEKKSYDIKIEAFQLSNDDSVKLYESLYKNILINEGVSEHLFDLDQIGSKIQLNPIFYEIISANKKYSAGAYVINILAFDLNSKKEVYNRRVLFSVDSTLDLSSGIRQKINRIILNEKYFNWVRKPKSFPNSESKLDQVNQINAKIHSKTGFEANPLLIKGKYYSELKHKNWFVGLYELRKVNELKNKIEAENFELKSDPTNFISTDFGKLPSINNQIKIYNNTAKKEINGEVTIQTCISNDQDPGSSLSNNYFDIQTSFSSKVGSFPIGVALYYTSLDNERQNTASYFRFFYNIDEAKSDIKKSIHVYDQKLQELESKQKGYALVYNEYLNRLNGEWTNLNSELVSLKASNQLQENPTINPEIANRLLLQNDSLSKIRMASSQAKKRDSINKVIELKQKKLELVQQKITKYRLLLNQYADRFKIDSTIAHKDGFNRKSVEDMSFKEMVNYANILLPDGKVKKFTSGLTHFEIGILNRYESKYTMSGQNLKGSSIGYDFGLASLSLSLGKTEYVSRSGAVESYSCLLLRSDFKKWKNQSFSVLYYNYSSPNDVLKSNNTLKNDFSIPSLAKPTQILSISHEGKIGNYIRCQNEVASSFKNAINTKELGFSNTAFKSELEINIPLIKSDVKGSWEQIGKNFENKSLPLNRAATTHQIYSIQSELFKSKIIVGVQYNIIRQEYASSMATNEKWGFDCRTNLNKRFPSLGVSYKPFTTFRSIADTNLIQQKPLLGSVWTAKSTYQLKRGNNVFRFVLVFNQNKSFSSDSMKIANQSVQTNFIYASKLDQISLNLGWLYSSSVVAENISQSHTYLTSVNYSRKLGQLWNFSAGTDLAIGRSKLERVSGNTTVKYQFKSQPIALNITGRYVHLNQYLSEDRNYGMLQLGIHWQLKADYKTNKTAEN